jgi:two-component system sensor histidine kinase DesK
MPIARRIKPLLERVLPLKDGAIHWVPLLWLVYLGFLFMPFSWPAAPHWLGATVLSVCAFVPLYVWAYRDASLRGRMSLAAPLVMALFAYALAPLNPCAYDYLAFAAATAPWALPGLWRPLLLAFGLLAAYLLELASLPHLPFMVLLVIATASTLVVPTICCASYFAREHERKQQALRLSQEQIRRLATLAERERIGRDLHDLLGHTLSLVAIKSELAGRLIARDAPGAAREIAEVQAIARDALKQVRAAVSGIRAAALEAEIAAARALLESAGVAFACTRRGTVSSAELEAALAMMLREAVTNIQRHADARNAQVEITAGSNLVTLMVRDDGRGGVVAHGNGLNGIAERVRALGGTLRIESRAEAGTTLNVELPRGTPTDAGAGRAESGAASVAAEAREAAPGPLAVT